MKSSTAVELELFDTPFPNCFHGGFARYVDPVDQLTGDRSKISKQDGYICQIDTSIERSVISAEIVAQLIPRGYRILSPETIGTPWDCTATIEPRPLDGEIVLDLILPVGEEYRKLVKDVPFVIDKDAVIPIRIGQEVLRLFEITISNREVDGESKRFAVLDVRI